MLGVPYGLIVVYYFLFFVFLFSVLHSPFSFLSIEGLVLRPLISGAGCNVNEDSKK